MQNESRGILDAIKQRKCIREFTPEVVSDELIQTLLEVARRSPSSKNTQPWKLTLFQGAALDALRADFLDSFDTGKHFYPEFPCELISEYRARAVALGKAIFAYKGFAREDMDKRKIHNRLNYQFFDAPQMFILGVDKNAYHEGTLVDCGIFAANLMLAIEGVGLGSCPQMSTLVYPNLLRRHIPQGDQQLFLMSLPFGYPKKGSHINDFVSTREPIENWFTVLK